MNRLFLVGCPRSGTTLLQSLLASHSDIVSFPETHLFSRTTSISPLIQFFTVYRSRHRQEVQNILSDFDLPTETVEEINLPVFRTRKWISRLLPVLDFIARSVNPAKAFLLEKTPRHLHYTGFIQAADPDARFIHIIRRGEDVVASLNEATTGHPEQWEGSRTIKKSIFWWNRSIRISEQCIGKANHYFVWYDELVEDTEAVLRDLFTKLDIPFEQHILDQHHKTASSLISEGEAWKAKNTKKAISASEKFNRLSPEDQELIRKSLYKFDFSRISISTANNS